MSIANTIGRGIGKTAAYGVHGAIRAAQGSGRFGADVFAGAEQAYMSESALLKAGRDQARIARDQARAKLAAAQTGTVALTVV